MPSRYWAGVKADSTPASAPPRASAAPAVAPAPGAWWNTLRVRFGILLALALLPWLVLIALEAVRSATQSRASEALRLDLLSENKVSEVALILEAGRFGLIAAPEIVREQGCEAGGADLLRRLDAYEAFVVQAADGTVTCQRPGALDALQLINASPFADDFRIELGRIDRGDGKGVRDVVLLQNRVPRTGEVYSLVLPTNLGLRDVLDAALGEEAIIALTKPGGGVILGRRLSSEQASDLTTKIQDDTITLLDISGASGEPRRIATTFVEDLGIYVTVGREVDASSRGLLTNRTAFLLPILAWVVGFALIWLGTQSMLIAPLARMRAAARQYAAGELDGRVRLGDSAAGEVRGLAQTFNRMARQIQERNARIADNLDEKDTLLREIHHRVKNNLQIIISLLNMQERKMQGEEAIDAISETRARINAIAVVHRGLYESSDLRSIGMRAFVSRLLSNLEDSLGLDERGIALRHEVEAIDVSADSAIPLALFIVEALGNAVKHGLDRGGHVDVRVGVESDMLVLDVADTGCGVGDPAGMSGVGTRLMHGFARQLGAELSFADNAPGLRATLHVPLEQVRDKDEPFQVRRSAK